MAFDRTQHSLQIKTPNTLGAEGTSLSRAEAGYGKHTVSVAVSGESPKHPPMIREGIPRL